MVKGSIIKKLIAKQEMQENEWYGIRSLLGNANWAMFYIILGAREAGKSYAVMEYFVIQWKKNKIPFTWLRLNEASTKKMLANKAEKFVDADIARKYNLELTVKGNNVYDHGEKMATILALSTFYADKGVALFDKDFLEDPNMRYHICLDEFQLEKGQRTQDVSYQFVNQLENLLRSEKDRVKVFLIGNTLEEASDILTLFEFIPEEFGRYKLKSKRAVIDYLPPTDAYKKRRKGSAADILMGKQSNFTNEIDFDRGLITKERLERPTQIIVFDKDTKFTIWDNKIIAKYNGEKVKQYPVAMRPYLDLRFDQVLRDQVIMLFDSRSFYFHNLITQKQFQKEIRLIKPRKS